MEIIIRGLVSTFLYHWEGVVVLLLLARVVWVLHDNEDLLEHRGHLRFGMGAVPICFVAGLVLGSATGNPLIGWLTAVVLTLAPLYYLSRVVDRAFNDMLGGLLFDMIFSEGRFADTFKKPRKLPNLTLLQHWRSHGLERRAWRVARRNLVAEPRAFPLWLFAAETAALHHRDIAKASRIVRRLQRCRKFSSDQRMYALQELKGWAARFGIHIDEQTFAGRRPRKKRDPVRVADRLRLAGLFQEARAVLTTEFQRHPENLASSLLLMRLYAQDLRLPHKAEKVLKEISSQPFISDAYLEFARRSITEWTSLPPETRERKRSWWQRVVQDRSEPPGPSRIKLSSPAPPGPLPRPSHSPETAGHSVEDLLHQGRLGTALEVAESQWAADPDDFQNWRQLIEILTRHAPNAKRSREFIEQIQQREDFSQEQKQCVMQLYQEAERSKYKTSFY